jgi:hypothetical protein
LYIETAVRDFVTEKAKDYLVITGSHGLLQLDDINGNKIEIHLNLEQSNIPRRLPAPRLLISNFDNLAPSGPRLKKFNFFKVVLENGGG